MSVITVGFNPAIDRIMECPDFQVGAHQTAEQIAMLAAGKAANVNRTLALLGIDSIATGFLGRGELDLFHDQLSSVGPGQIACHFIEVQGRTRENITIIDPARRVETHLRTRGFSVTKNEATLLKKRLAKEVNSGDYVVFSGSLCEGIAPDYLVSMIEQCNKVGARVAVDSSGDALKAAAECPLWLVKPNIEEFRMLVGQEVPNASSAVRDAAVGLLKNVENVLVSRGAAGAVLVTRHGTFVGKSNCKETPLRTVSCGDHLLAGYIGEFMGGKPEEAALRSAIGIAAARAMSPDLAEFDRKFAKEGAEVEVSAV